MRRWWLLTEGRRRILFALAVPAVLAVAATVVLAVLAGGTTRVLSDNVRLTQNLVDGNVRTLSQVQRELLRLEVSLGDTPPDPARIDLARSLAAQRIQEGTLDYQGRTLGDAAMLQRSRDLAARWRGGLDPQVKAVVADPSALTPATRERLTGGIVELELSYNQLVSDAEIVRKTDAQRANRATAALVVDTRWLLAGLVATIVALVVLVAGMVRVLLDARRAQLVQTERLQAARALLQRHSVAVQTTDNLVVITDADGRIEWVNDAFIRRTGYSLDEASGRSPGALLQGPDTDPETIAFMRAKLSAHDPFVCEVLNYSRDGEAYWVSLEVRPIIDDLGAVTGFVAVQSDITERRLTEATLRSAMAAAEESAKAKERFLATMSHEIRTPLHAVLGLTELLLDTDIGDEQRAYVATAHQSGLHLLTIVNDILDYSALESGRVEVESHDTDVRALLSEVCDMLRPVADQLGLWLSCTVDGSVPDRVRTDVVRVRQVLINLVGNGLKFTERGGVAMHVEYSTAGPDGSTGETAAGHLVVSVRDTGIGVSEDRLETIFDPFTQVDPSTTRTHGGTGLGLAICTRIAHRLGGTLEVSSVEGEGSVFTFTVPVLHAAEPAPADAGPPGPSPDPTPVGREVSGLAVLVAEDDADVRLVAVHMLRRLGLEADVATDGVEALAACAKRNYDVVLMDVNMPRLDGIAATARLREREGHQPWVVALTANAMERDRDRVLDAGMDDYLSKPYTLDGLERALAGATHHVTA